MNDNAIEFDDVGWAAIHHCVTAEVELLKSIEQFVSINPAYLEVETKDANQMSPFLLACERDKRKSIDKLLELGACIEAKDASNHSAVEICAMTENMELLHYFIELNHKDLDVWKRLVKFLSADTEEECEKAALMLSTLSSNPDPEDTSAHCDNPHWEALVNAGAIPALINACKASSALECTKGYCTTALRNLVEFEGVTNLIAKHSGVPVLVNIIKKDVKRAIPNAMQCLKAISENVEFASKINDCALVPLAVKMMQALRHPFPAEVLADAITVIGNISKINEKSKLAVGSTVGIFDAMHSLFDQLMYQTSVLLLQALTNTIGQLVADCHDNQQLCIEAGGATPLIIVSQANKYRELQISAIDGLYQLAKDNPESSRNILEDGAVMTLMQLLKKTRAVTLQEVISRTLWTLAGTDINEKRSMAFMIGVNMLIEFVTVQGGDDANHLNYIGCEGLSVLAQGAHNMQTVIQQNSGAPPLVRQLRSSNPDVVTSAIRALRYLCLGLGYIPNPTNQSAVAKSRGLKFLVALMAHSKAESIQVEAAVSLGACVLGHAENLQSIQENPDFTYLHIVRLLYSSDEMVRLTAGTALATFAFNNISVQKEIAECGGVRWQNFFPLLSSPDDFFAVSASFQAVVLSRIIPDEEPALTSAMGIKTLIERLQKTKSSDIRGLAADCVARLAHTRAGVPSAMLAIDAVKYLSVLLQENNEQVRGSAAVALGYLSFDHTAERQMLHVCRDKPHLIHALKYYTKNHKLSDDFLEGWQHCKHVGLLHISHSDIEKMKRSFEDRMMQPQFNASAKEMSSAFKALTEESSTVRSQSQHHSSRASQLLASIHDDKASYLQAQSVQSSHITHNSTPANLLPL